MDSASFVRLSLHRDALLLERSPWPDKAEFDIFQTLRHHAVYIIEEGVMDWAFLSWRSKEHAAGRRYPCEESARAAYRARLH